LAMSRNEIGNYLGLAVETVSRVFTRFQHNELLTAEGKEINLINLIELCALAGGNLDNWSLNKGTNIWFLMSSQLSL